MINDFFPRGILEKNVKSYSPQSLLFGHRMKPAETPYEYLIEFLCVANAHKKITDGSHTYILTDMFPVNEMIYDHVISYMPVSNMGLKRFIFFANSRMDTKAACDKDAYNSCIEMLKKHIDNEGSNIDKDKCLSVVQNILYGFSVENAGRSWFTKNLLPICPEVLFPESLGTQKFRSDAKFDHANNDFDREFSFNQYTYMCRGGEIYYLHVLHAINKYQQYKEPIEAHLDALLNIMPEISEISGFIQKKWAEYAEIKQSTDDDPDVKKELSAIPLGFQTRDECTVSELNKFLSCSIQPMEKLDVFTYGIILQMLRMMYSAAADGAETGNSAWILDMSTGAEREKAEIKKLAVNSFSKNEENIIKYLSKGIEYFYGEEDRKEKERLFSKAEADTYKLFRKLAKNIGILIPVSGPGMRFTLSEEIIKFLVMSLVGAGQKITYDRFLDLMYEHFGMVVSQEHYRRAADDGAVPENENVMFLNANKNAFAQKLKDCGFLRDLSDATAIVENPYEKEEV